MKKIIFALASVFTASALTGCGSDPEEVALGMVKAIVSGDAEKAASYCSPEAKTRCNVKDAKFIIERYKDGLASMKAYYDKAAEPEFQIGQKKHEDYRPLGGPEIDEILVIDVKNRPGSKDDPSDYTFKFEISDKGAVSFPRYSSWENSSEEPLQAAVRTKKWVNPIVTEKYTLTNEQLAQKFDDVVSGKEPAYEGWGDKRPYMAELLKKFHYFDSYLKNGTDLKADRLSKLWSCPTNCAWSRTGWVLANVIEETLKDNITVTLAKDPHACSVLATGPDGKFILNKEKDYLECDRDGQNYLFQRFRDYLLKDEPALIKKYAVK